MNKTKTLEQRLAEAELVEERDSDPENTPEIPAVDILDRGGDTSSVKRISVKLIDTKRCRPWKFHNRSKVWLEGERLSSLVESIRVNGQQQLGLVRQVEGDPKCDYEIIYGYRRWAACDALGIRYEAKVVPPETSDQACAQLTSTENEDSEDISDLEKAIWYQRQLKENLFKDQKEMAEAFGLSQGYVSRLVTAAKVTEYDWIMQLLDPVIIDVPVRKADEICRLLKSRNSRERMRRVADIMISNKEVVYPASEVVRTLIEAGKEKSKNKELVLAKKGKKAILVLSEDSSGGVRLLADKALYGHKDLNELINRVAEELEKRFMD